MRKFVFSLLFLLYSITTHAAAVGIEFVGPGTSVPYHGVYAGYYEAKVDGITTFVMCDDFTRVIHPGDTWEAEVYTYADAMGGAATKFSGVEKYAQAGWLYSQTAAATPSLRAQIQGALWNIMSPGSVPMDALAQWYHDEATGGSHDNFVWEGIMNVLTPKPFIAGQEFLVPTPVPLPASFLLFGSGIACLCGYARRQVSLIGISRRRKKSL